ncbi:sorting nexin-10B isoform X1 [Oncorhynchus mykiss]|uniref:Sorting nexin 10a n=1 Tax=Oncorhynchus mykiss TaxID=8022 RepID=A0A8C7PQS3_ONCMY|nr:sorting nexin-10B isoform X1 [Oncorhynchus mykiss]
MEIDSLMKQEFVSVWVQEPQFHKDDFWHTHVDYEICLHTNSMCFRKKTSSVRRRYSEFVWLRQRLQDNTMLIELPKLPPRNPFFSMKNPYKVNQRMNGLREFLEIILQDPLLLSDSRVHLFLQSQLSMTKMEACVLGRTRYTVAQAIQMCSDCHRTRFPIEKGSKVYFNSDCESLTSTTSSLGHSHDSGVPQSPSPLPFDCSTCKNSDGNIRIRDEGFFSSLSESSCDQEHMEP